MHGTTQCLACQVVPVWNYAQCCMDQAVEIPVSDALNFECLNQTDDGVTNCRCGAKGASAAQHDLYVVSKIVIQMRPGYALFLDRAVVAILVRNRSGNQKPATRNIFLLQRSISCQANNILALSETISFGSEFGLEIEESHFALTEPTNVSRCVITRSNHGPDYPGPRH